jgi:hypothetical protein
MDNNVDPQTSFSADIAGRMIVSSVQQADEMVNKIIEPPRYKILWKLA